MNQDLKFEKQPATPRGSVEERIFQAEERASASGEKEAGQQTEGPRGWSAGAQGAWSGRGTRPAGQVTGHRSQDLGGQTKGLWISSTASARTTKHTVMKVM